MSLFRAAAVALLVLAACDPSGDGPEARQVDDARADCERRDVSEGVLTLGRDRPCAGMDLRQASVGATDALRLELTVDDDRTDPPVIWGVVAVIRVPGGGDGQPDRWVRLRCDRDRLEAGVVVGNGPFQAIDLDDRTGPGCRRERTKVLVAVAFEFLDLGGDSAAGRQVAIDLATTARAPGRAYPRLIDRLDEVVTVEIPADSGET